MEKNIKVCVFINFCCNMELITGRSNISIRKVTEELCLEHSTAWGQRNGPLDIGEADYLESFEMWERML